MWLSCSLSLSVSVWLTRAHYGRCGKYGPRMRVYNEDRARHIQKRSSLTTRGASMSGWGVSIIHVYCIDTVYCLPSPHHHDSPSSTFDLCLLHSCSSCIQSRKHSSSQMEFGRPGHTDVRAHAHIATQMLSIPFAVHHTHVLYRKGRSVRKMIITGIII